MRGDFALSKETLVLAVKDTSVPSKNRFSGGEVVAVVELTLQEPNGKLPKSWRFLTPWAAGVSSLKIALKVRRRSLRCSGPKVHVQVMSDRCKYV